MNQGWLAAHPLVDSIEEPQPLILSEKMDFRTDRLEQMMK